MTRSEMALPRFLRVSSALIILGLIAEIVSLVWFHPLAFVVFVFVAASLVAIGMVVYLVSLVFVAAPLAENRKQSSE
jgi:hypothetical protein